MHNFLKANKVAVGDLIASIKLYFIWSSISKKTMFVKYNRSKLSFFWPFINSFFFAFVLSFIFAEINKQDFDVYAPYLISGFIVWNFFQSVISDMTSIFSNNSSFIKELNYHLFFYVLKKLHEICFIFIVNIFIFTLISLFFFNSLQINFFLLFINIPLFFLLSIFIGLTFGIVNCYFRDFSFIISNVMRLMFFVTPILWLPQNISGFKSVIVNYNPFFYMLNLFRAPLTGGDTMLYGYLLYLLILILFYLCSLFLYINHKDKLALFI